VYSSPLHYHENPHISLLLQGGHSEKRINAEFERLPGDIFFCHGGEAHQFITKTFPSKNLNLEIDYQFLHQYGIDENNVCDAVKENLNTKFLILKMYKESVTQDDFSETSIQVLMLSLIKDSIKFNNKSKPKWALLLVEILNDRWNDHLTLNELSNLTAVHPVTISKYFTKYFTCTFGEYMRRLKINRSISLIKNSGLSLTEISLECGFTDQSHFIRTFKEITGWLPGKFRQL